MPVALVRVLMGSKSDWETMQHAVATLEELGIACDARALSAHRTPQAVEEYVRQAETDGAQVFIAAAGGAAHLAGVIAARTQLPVLGVPMESKLNGLDSLLSIAQMPAGIPVGTLAVGKAGAINAALLAAAVLALASPSIAEALRGFRQRQTQKALRDSDVRGHP